MRFQKRFNVLLASLLVVAGVGLVTPGQGADGGVRLLLVDETKTFASTMRVGALAGALKKTGLFDVAVRLVDVADSYDDPLQAAQPDSGQAPFDVIAVLPRGLDDGSTTQIWLVTAAPESLTPTVRAGLNAASFLIDQVFQGLAEAMDATEDLWPGLLAALYLKKGWLQ